MQSCKTSLAASMRNSVFLCEHSSICFAYWIRSPPHWAQSSASLQIYPTAMLHQAVNFTSLKLPMLHALNQQQGVVCLLCVLGPAGRELIFFIAAQTVLFFTFVLKIVNKKIHNVLAVAGQCLLIICFSLCFLPGHNLGWGELGQLT